MTEKSKDQLLQEYNNLNKLYEKCIIKETFFIGIRSMLGFRSYIYRDNAEKRCTRILDQSEEKFNEYMNTKKEI